MCLHSGCNDGDPPNWWWELGPRPVVTLLLLLYGAMSALGVIGCIYLTIFLYGR